MVWDISPFVYLWNVLNVFAQFVPEFEFIPMNCPMFLKNTNGTIH